MSDYDIESMPAARYRPRIRAVERVLDRAILALEDLFAAGVRLDDFEPHTRHRIAGLLGIQEPKTMEIYR